MQPEIKGSDKVSDDDMDSQTCNEIESKSDATFLDDHGLIEELASRSKDYVFNPIDYYRCVIADEIIDFMVCATQRDRYVLEGNQVLMKRS